MPKRMTDTQKWNKEWFTDLEPKMKLFWFYILDNCDHAGIWEINLKLASFLIGYKYKIDEIIAAFNGKIILLPDNKLFIAAFCKYQYRTVSQNLTNVSSSVLNRLQKCGIEIDNDFNIVSTPGKPFANPSSRVLVKVKDKVNIKNKIRLDFEALYQKYPRKVGKQVGLRKCKTEIKTQQDYDLLSQAIDAYRANCEKEKTDARYIKHFSSFMSSWRDWLDADAGNGEDFSNNNTPLTVEDLE